jgi:hypothetical protein
MENWFYFKGLLYYKKRDVVIQMLLKAIIILTTVYRKKKVTLHKLTYLSGFLHGITKLLNCVNVFSYKGKEKQ